MIVETETGEFSLVLNDKTGHERGMCRPMAALGKRVDIVIAGGIGGGALRKLIQAGIRVYRSVEGTVQENLDLITSDKLEEFSPFHTCGGHGPGHECH